ncbi:helix-turn-helix domain-containing protein [Mycobacteroides chelonae]|uniref:helix-turn-helix domain-containing protein n=1 Tax=Mycobacteroides chelonae TaxID=1774 RepID=UPI0039EC04C2
MNQLKQTQIGPAAHTHGTERPTDLFGAIFAELGSYEPTTGQDPQVLYNRLLELTRQTGALFGAYRAGVTEWSAPAAITAIYGHSGDHILVLDPAGAATAAIDPQQMAQWLHANSGLTGDQLGRILGVSRRTVYLWATGKRVNGKNLERLVDVYRTVHELSATTPDGRRSRLFSPRYSARNLFDELADKARKPEPPNPIPTVAHLLGIDE